MVLPQQRIKLRYDPGKLLRTLRLVHAVIDRHPHFAELGMSRLTLLCRGTDTRPATAIQCGLDLSRHRNSSKHAGYSSWAS